MADEINGENSIQDLEFTKKQSAKTYGPRIILNLVRIRHERGKTGEAHDLLKGVYDRFMDSLDSVRPEGSLKNVGSIERVKIIIVIRLNQAQIS